MTTCPIHGKPIDPDGRARNCEDCRAEIAATLAERSPFDLASEAYDAWEAACERAGAAAVEAQAKIDAYAELAEVAQRAKQAYLVAIAAVPGWEHARPSIPAHLRGGPS